MSTDDNANTSLRWAYLGRRCDASEAAYIDLHRASAGAIPSEGSHADMNRRLFVNAELCSGCRACEMGCSYAHEGLYSSALARLHVVKLEESGLDRPMVCLRCMKAPCATACPVGAITQDPLTRIVTVQPDVCVGCGLCAEACVSGVIQLRADTALPLLCDLCGGDPECVKKCPTGALVAREGRDLEAKRTRQRLGERSAKQLSKGWASDPKRPVDTPMKPPDPDTGVKIDPPPAYGGDPPSVLKKPTKVKLILGG